MDKERIEKAIRGAISTRGKNKGYIKKSPPASRTDEYAAWQALMMSQNPYKVTMGVMLFSPEQQQIFDAVLEITDRGEVAKDKDREALQAMGVW